MTTSTPRILLLGDYSNFHATLAHGLRALGCHVHLASDGCGWMQCQRDTDISRRHGKIGGLMHYISLRRLLSGPIKGYDIVAFHDPMFTKLRPAPLRSLLNIIKRNNGPMFLSAISTDIAYLDMLQGPKSPLRYSEWFINGRPSPHHIANKAEWEQWHSPELIDYQNYFFSQINGAVSGLYEYHLGMLQKLGRDNCAYGGIPINTSLYTPITLPEKPQPIKLFLGRDKYRKLMKGSHILEQAALQAIKQNPGIATLNIIENIPFSQFKTQLTQAHIVLDQIYSYTPATTALMAMAYGLNVISGAEPEYYNFINEHINRPIINAPIEIDHLTDTIQQIITNPQQIHSRGIASRKFVEKHNEATTVAERYLNFWTSKC